MTKDSEVKVFDDEPHILVAPRNRSPSTETVVVAVEPVAEVAVPLPEAYSDSTLAGADEGPVVDDAVKMMTAHLQGWNAAVAAIVAEFDLRVARGPANDQEGHRRARDVVASFARE